ncbi:MAG: flagellin lysine-N-methylase [Clostridia bacterium]|nr:flagellin lysine-N-methylase [Clostridia bacterium]
MEEYVLSYYPKFSCIKGECKHTCCAGWEINIDPDTLDFYENFSGPYKEKLIKGIRRRKSQFKLRKGRCAFLKEDGLCDLIINMGEDRLCQVCRDHPRFRSFFSNRMEVGIGFTCEEATRIILSSTDKISLIKTSKGNEEKPLDFTEQKVFEFRTAFISLIQDRTVPFSKRVENAIKLSNGSGVLSDFNKVKKLFLSFERANDFYKKVKKLTSFTEEISEELSIYFEHFLVNFAYRHFATARDTLEVRGIAISGIISLMLLNGILVSEKDFSCYTIAELFRQFSTEVEYSNKNLYRLYSFSEKKVKI